MPVTDKGKEAGAGIENHVAVLTTEKKEKGGTE